MNEKNVSDLKASCKKIISLLDEAPEGDFMVSQLICLADGISEFVENPIVKNSGLINN